MFRYVAHHEMSVHICGGSHARHVFDDHRNPDQQLAVRIGHVSFHLEGIRRLCSRRQ